MINYTHDSLDRLTAANILLPNENAIMNYAYDGVGNRTMMLINSSKPSLVWYNEYGPTLDEVPFINKPMQVTYTYNELDQLISEYGQEKLKGNGYGSPYGVYYDYDADGNMTGKTLYKGWSSYPPTAGSEKITTYSYDAEDRLMGIQFPNNQSNTFYDCICGVKQMEWIDANGEVTRYFLDGDQVLFEYDGNNQIKSRYTNGSGIDERISVTNYNSTGQKTAYYYHYDALGSVVAMTDSTGKLIETYDYDPFGVIIDHDRNVTKNLYTYTGRNYIPDAGMYYYRNRYYDPRVGRFTTLDPLFKQSLNLSAMVTTISVECPTCDGINEKETAHFDLDLPLITIASILQQIKPISHPYVYVADSPINFTDPTGKDIYLQTGNNTGDPINDAYHQKVCVDLWTVNCCKMEGRMCFSFMLTGVRFPIPSMSWLGWNSVNLGGPLKGKIYSDPYTGGTINTKHTTTCKQDLTWLKYMSLTRMGTEDTFSALRHNCRLYSRWEFRDAPLHMGSP